MLNLTTNQSSLIAQLSLLQSTNKLNCAIERLNSGFKVNGAKDNAADSAIITELSTKITSYDVAEDNIAEGLNAVSYAQDNIDLMSNIIERLQQLSLYAQSGTMDEESLNAINREGEQLIEEFNNLKNTTAYENQGLFNDINDYKPLVDQGGVSTVDSSESATYKEEILADENTYLKDILSDLSAEVTVKDKTDTQVGTITLNDTMQLKDLFSQLSAYGMTGSITDGIITLESSNGNYITGLVADELGLTAQDITVGISTTTNQLTSASTVVASETTLLTEIGLSIGDSLNLRNSSGTLAETISVTDTMKVSDLITQIESLSSGNLSAELTDGVLSINSASGWYVDGTVAEKLGIGDVSGTVGVGASSSGLLTYSITQTVNGTTTLGEMGIGNTSFLVKATNGDVLKTVEVSSTTDLDTLVNTVFQNNTISATLTDGVIAITGGNVVDGELANLLGLGVASSSSTGTVGTSGTSTASIIYTTIGTVGISQTSKIVTYSASVAQTTTDDMFKGTTVPEPTSAEQTFNLDVWRSGLTNTYDVSSTEDGGSIVLDGTTYVVAKTRDTLYSNLSANVNVILGSDIDLSDGNWTPISGYNNRFNGNGFVVSNMTVNLTGSNKAGMFATLGANTTISNLVLENSSVTSGGYAGSLAGYGNPGGGDFTITNCCVTNATINSTSSSDYSKGGLIGGATNAEITNCNIYNVSINGKAKHAGGLCGEAATGNQSIVIKNCNVYNVSISVSTDYSSSASGTGGLLGHTSAYFYIDGCGVYNSTITMNSSNATAYVGGLVGNVDRSSPNNYNGLYIKNCTVRVASSEISASSNAVGAVIGRIGGKNFSNVFSGNVYDNTIYTGSAAYDYTLYKYELRTASSSTTLSRLNSNLSSYTGFTITVVQTDTEQGVAIKGTDTISQMCNKLGSVGITATFADGKLTLAGDENAYIKNVYYRLGTDPLTANFGLSIGNGYTYTSNTVTINATSTSTLGEFGLGSTQNIVVNQNGTDYTITVDGSTTIGDSATSGTLAYMLDQKGIGLTISDGKITLSGSESSYIKSMDTDLSNVIKIEAGEGKTYNGTTVTTYSNTASGTMSVTQSTTVTTLSTLSTLGIGSNQTITINQAGTDKTTVLTSASTVGDLINALKSFGLNASLTNGIFSLEGSNDSFIKFFGTDLTSALKLSGNYTSVTKTNTDSSPLRVSGSITATATTTFAELGLKNTTTVTIVNNGKTQSFNVKASTTLQDFITELNSKGINTELSNGKLVINGTENSYISNIGALAPIFGVSDYTSTKKSNTNSSVQKTSITYTADGSTTLGRFGINRATLSIKKDGVLKTINLTKDSTIDMMLSNLSTYGITGNISDGKVHITGGDLNFVSSASDNLVRSLNLVFNIADTAVKNSASEGVVYGPGTFNIQVGINAEESSLISFNATLKDIDTEQFITNGLQAEGTIESLKDILTQLNEKSVYLGVTSSQLESALELVNSMKMNMISSRSTLRDADITEESSEYLRQQILWQASATLMATANQSPAIALQLI